jgi:hypothetical protein
MFLDTKLGICYRDSFGFVHSPKPVSHGLS